ADAEAVAGEAGEEPFNSVLSIKAVSFQGKWGATWAMAPGQKVRWCTNTRETCRKARILGSPKRRQTMSYVPVRRRRASGSCLALGVGTSGLLEGVSEA